MATTFSFAVDWGANGIYVDETAYLREARARLGMPESGSPGDALPAAPAAAPGWCAVTLDNSTRRFSPENGAGPLYGKLAPLRRARLIANDGSIPHPIFTGWIDSIAPTAGLNGERLVTITLIDGIGRLAANRIGLPLQQAVRADQVISLALAATYTPAATALAAGAETFDIAADRWDPEHTTALEIIREAAASEGGRAFAQPDDTFTFLNRAWFFTAAAPALALSDAHPVTIEASERATDLFNEVAVTAHPRATVGVPGVLARAVTSLRIPPIGPGGAGTRDIRLRFRDAATGEFVGGTDVTPPVPFTDYTLNERKDGLGVDYTVSPYTSVTVLEQLATSITLRVTNSALGVLYLNNLQVRGRAITRYDPVTATAADAGSQAVYGRRSLRVDLPLPGDTGLADGLAAYLLDQRKAPFLAPRHLTIRDFDRVAGVNVFALRLFDSITLSDSQTGLAGVRCWVTAIETTLTPGRFTRRFTLERADLRRYFALDTAGYAELDANTRLGV